MATTNTTTNPLGFIDDNFDYINLIMFVGLYIACFVYLLQDSVKELKMGFSNMIGIFVAQFFFLIIALYLFPQNQSWSASKFSVSYWYSIVITLGLEFVSALMLLLEYKKLQDINIDDAVLESDIAGTKYRLSGPYSPDDFYTNALICCDVIIAIFMILLLKSGGTDMNVLKYLSPIIIPGLLVVSSIMVYFSSTAKNVRAPDLNNTYPAIKEKMIPALMILCLFHVLFVFFVSFLISKNDIISSNWILKLSWISVFFSILFQIMSIFVMIITYKYLNDNYLSKNVPLKFSGLLNEELKDYNNLFVAATSIVIVFVGVLLYNNENLKSQTSFFFQPYYYSIFIYSMGIAMLSLSSEMLRISNDFVLFKKNAPKSVTNKDLDNNRRTKTVDEVGTLTTATAK